MESELTGRTMWVRRKWWQKKVLRVEVKTPVEMGYKVFKTFWMHWRDVEPEDRKILAQLNSDAHKTHRVRYYEKGRVWHAEEKGECSLCHRREVLHPFLDKILKYFNL